MSDGRRDPWSSGPATRRLAAEVVRYVAGGFPRLDRATCEDLAQTAFEELLSRSAKVARGELAPLREPELVWLRRCAWRRARDHVRDSREEPFDPTEGTFLRLAAAPGPEERLIARQGLVRSTETVFRLRAPERAAYSLRLRHDLTARELGPQLGCSKSTAAARLARAGRAVHDEDLRDGSWHEGSLALARAVSSGDATPHEHARYRSLHRFDVGFAPVAAEARCA